MQYTPEIILLLNNIMNEFAVTFLVLLDIALPPFFVVCTCYHFQQMQLMVTLFNILLFLLVVNYLFTVLCKDDIIKKYRTGGKRVSYERG